MLKKKICIVGSFGVGKTSLVRRFVDTYLRRELPCHGWRQDRPQRCEDRIHSGHFGAVGSCRRGRLGAAQCIASSRLIGVYPCCRRMPSHDPRESDRYSGPNRTILGPLPFVIVVNKADLRDQWEVKGAMVEERGWATFETSAKAGSGVEEMFQHLAEKLLSDDVPSREQVE